MTALAGDFFLLQMWHTQDATYQTLGGLQTRALLMRASPLERPLGSSRWRNLVTESGVSSMQFEGSGVFSRSASDLLMTQLFMQSQHTKYRLVMPGFGSFSGPFALVELAYEGRTDDEISWRLALQSSGEIGFTTPPAQ